MDRKSNPRQALIKRLTETLPPGLPQAATVDLIRELLDGTEPDQLAARLAARHPSSDIESQQSEVAAAAQRIRELPELAPLMAG